MIIVYGLYKFAQQLVGYRQDFCNNCRTPVVAQRMRYFRCGHLFWIPLLPLGFRETWHCSQCTNDPRGRYVERPWLLLIGGAFLGLFGFVALVMTIVGLIAPKTVDMPKDGVGMFSGIGLGCLFFAWLLFRMARNIKEDPFVRPILTPNTETCPMCVGKLSNDPHLHCPSCHVRIYTD
jgi:hypothetical protein